MTIAVNIKINGKDELDKNDNFIFETFSRIIKAQPQHTFVLISERPIIELFISSSNVINAVIGQQTKFPAQWYIWYNIKINTILKKYKADIFISYGIGSATTKIPQCIIIPDLDFIHHPKVFKKTHLLFYKTFLPRCIKNSKLIITVSEFCKADIINQYKTNTETIDVVYRGVNDSFKEISYGERENIKTTYADGNEYFIYKGDIGSNKNLLNLCKAFSAFKKRQKSNMQLLIAGKQGWKYEEVIESLRHFKFKEDVKILHNISLDELIKITASAYSFVSASLYESFTTEIIQAMKSGVPVITSSEGVMPEICADAALYVNTDNFKAFAIEMMSLFKDEDLRKVLIKKCKMQAEKFSWEITTDLLWNRLQKTFNA
jgi:glycosyltransferase involved in cell wall biosynthesis